MWRQFSFEKIRLRQCGEVHLNLERNVCLLALSILSALLIIEALTMPPPDADLYPEATGLAKSLVDQHSEQQPLKLFAGWFCPFGVASSSM